MTDLKDFTTVSASSITTFLDCPRKFFFKYVLGERPEPGPAMKHGSKVHADIEHYLTGEKDDLETVEAIEANAQGMIPDPSDVDNDLVEYSANDLGLSIAGKDFLGYLDLVEIKDYSIRITDWKTRGGFSYAPDSKELQEDFQAGLYAWATFHLADEIGLDVDQLTFRHGNLLRVDHKRGRDSPRSREVTCTFERGDVESWIDDRVTRIVNKMKSVAAKQSAKHVEKETDNCYKYGPCEYMDPIGSLRGRSCHDINYQPQQQKSKGDAMSMMDMINNDDEQTTDQDTPEQEDQVPEDSSGGLEAAKADFQGGTFEDLEDYDLSAMRRREFRLWRDEQLQEDTEEQKQSDTPPVNPPDAAPDQEPQDLADQVVGDFDFTEVDNIGGATEKKIRQKIEDDGIEELIELVDYDLTKIKGIGSVGAENLEKAIKEEENWTPDPEDTPQDILLEDAKQAAREGRWDDFETMQQGMTEDTLATLETWADMQTRESPEDGGKYGGDSDPEPENTGQKEQKTDRDSGDFPVRSSSDDPSILYIDCRPSKGDHAASLQDLLQPAKEVVADEEGLRYWNADRYSKGRKLLVDVVLEDPSMFDDTSVYARSSDEGMDQLLPELRQFFDVVVEA